jgi:DNA polymerase-4
MTKPRKIIHCDCDCFYASIEMRDNPALAGLPLAVGGSPQNRGVVATCSYEARAFGIHSAMPMATALRQCPDLVIVRPRMDVYREASKAVHRIFQDFTHLIEPLSLDEAYLDVSDTLACKGSATLIAQEIRRRVKAEVGITISAGIAPSKFIAKIASDWNKPDGQFVVLPQDVDEFVRKLEVKKLFGVGKVTAAKLNGKGIFTCNDLRQFSESQLTMDFGSFGKRLYQLSRGIDERPVSTNRIRKSLSVENTYSIDLSDLDSCLKKIPELHEQLLLRLSNVLDRYRISKQYVKIKFNDFVSTTAEEISTLSAIERFEALCIEAHSRGNRPVRLIGVGVKLEPLGATGPTSTTTSNLGGTQLRLKLTE